MAYKLIWSPAARDDLHDIVIFIARDNPNRAMSFGYELFPRLIDCKNFQRWAASCLSTGMIAFARSSFAHIELCTEFITTESFVRLRAFGIQRVEYCSCKGSLISSLVVQRQTASSPRGLRMLFNLFRERGQYALTREV
jgi:hypothetical protein